MSTLSDTPRRRLLGIDDDEQIIVSRPAQLPILAGKLDALTGS